MEEAGQAQKSDLLSEKGKRLDSVTNCGQKKEYFALIEQNHTQMTVCDLCVKQEALFKCSKCGKVLELRIKMSTQR